MQRRSDNAQPSAADAAAAQRVLAWLFYTSFYLAGCAIGSFGVLLPLLLPALHRSDAKAGLVLFGFFAGSSVGSLFARGRLSYAFVGGCLLAASSAVALATLHSLPLLLPTTTYGLGLGLCMTSVSLQQSRARASRRIAEFARLNLIWAAGALSGPVLCLYVARHASVAPVFLGVALAFAIVAGGSLLVSGEQWMSAPIRVRSSRRAVWRRIVPLLVTIPLATGLESAAGGWLATYASRSGLQAWNGVTLPTCFWAGLLLCRLYYTVQHAAKHEAGTLRTLAWLTLLGTVLLASWQTPAVLFAGSALLGWGIGSLYPVALAMLLRTTELSNLGFLIAGVGGALVPFVTGLISQHFHSLRAGIIFLVVPASVLVFTGMQQAWRVLENVLEEMPSSRLP